MTPAPRRSAGSPFADRVLTVVSRVPPGRVATYGDIAAAAGRPGAARAVGTLMRLAPRGELPYHRIIAANGRLGGYGGRIALKAGLLRAEGLVVRGDRVVNFEERRWPHAGRRKSHGPHAGKGPGAATRRSTAARRTH